MTQDPALQPILCLLGHPAAGKPMQLGMERVFTSAGLDWRYLTLDVVPESLGEALRGIRSLGFRGAHLFRPHNTASQTLVDEAVGSAAIAGWIDCVSIDEEKIYGHNRWGAIVREFAQESYSGEASAALTLGTEHDLLAIGVELAMHGWAKVYVDPAHTEAAIRLNGQLQRDVFEVRRPKKRWSDEVRLVVRSYDSTGKKAAVDLDQLDHLPKEACLVDLARMTTFSQLTKAAEQRGLRAISGLEALVHYTADTFQYWTGQPANCQVLRDAYEEYYEI